MFKLFCAALPLVARVALAAPTVTERCHDPEPYALPFSSPVSTDPTTAPPFDAEPFISEPFDLEPVILEPVDLEPVDLGPFDSPSSELEPLAFNPSDLGPDTEASALPLSDPLLGNPASVPFTSPASSSRDETAPQPETRPSTSTDDDSSRKRPSHSSKKRKNVVYFANWSIYGANFLPQNVPANEITHLLYAFAGISEDGSVVSIDPWADEQKLLGNQARDDSQLNNVHGAVEQVFLLKKKHRQMKTLLSIGGWTASQEGKFDPAISSAEGRRRFAQTAVKLLADWGFDGLDIDYEYPLTEDEAQNFVYLLRECREALDDYAESNGQRYHYLLTVATSAGPHHYNLLDMNGMDKYIDAWHLMAYDYAGSWDNVSGDQANVYADPQNPASTKFSTNEAVDDYIAYGIDPSKIILGLPLYGRSFLNTDGLGQPFSGIGQGSIEKGIWLYRDLPQPGSTVHVDRDTISSYSYDPWTRELVTYDNVEAARLKAKYLLSRDLGGAVFWEASGDKVGEKSLVRTLAKEMGNLDDSENMLEYPQSRFANIKNSIW